MKNKYWCCNLADNLSTQIFHLIYSISPFLIIQIIQPALQATMSLNICPRQVKPRVQAGQVPQWAWPRPWSVIAWGRKIVEVKFAWQISRLLLILIHTALGRKNVVHSFCPNVHIFGGSIGCKAMEIIDYLLVTVSQIHRVTDSHHFDWPYRWV